MRGLCLYRHVVSSMRVRGFHCEPSCITQCGWAVTDKVYAPCKQLAFRGDQLHVQQRRLITQACTQFLFCQCDSGGRVLFTGSRAAELYALMPATSH